MNLKKMSIATINLIVKLILVIAIVMVVYKVATKAYDFGFQVFADEAMEEEPGVTIEVSITKGKSAMDIGKILVEKGLIKDKYIFYIQSIVYEKKDLFIPGVYQLNTSMNSEEILTTITTEDVETENTDALLEDKQITNEETLLEDTQTTNEDNTGEEGTDDPELTNTDLNTEENNGN